MSDVTRLNSSRIDSMESWFLAETLKYLVRAAGTRRVVCAREA